MNPRKYCWRRDRPHERENRDEPRRGQDELAELPDPSGAQHPPEALAAPQEAVGPRETHSAPRRPSPGPPQKRRNPRARPAEPVPTMRWRARRPLSAQRPACANGRQKIQRSWHVARQASPRPFNGLPALQGASTDVAEDAFELVDAMVADDDAAALGAVLDRDRSTELLAKLGLEPEDVRVRGLRARSSALYPGCRRPRRGSPLFRSRARSSGRERRGARSRGAIAAS